MRRKGFKTKKVNISLNFIKNKIKVTVGVFLNFIYDSNYLETKKVDDYLISFEPQMVRGSYKDHPSKLKYRLSKGWSFESYISLSFWWFLTLFGDNYVESSRQDLKTSYSYAISSSKMSHSNLKYCFWLVKFTLDGIDSFILNGCS